MVHPTLLLKNLISTDVDHFLPFFLRVQISLPYKRIGKVSALHTCILENFSTKFGLKVLFRILSIWKIFLVIVEYSLQFHMKI